jgi:hypothetical protein
MLEHRICEKTWITPKSPKTEVLLLAQHSMKIHIANRTTDFMEANS